MWMRRYIHSLRCLPILAHVFEAGNALDKLEGFTSLYGSWFYGEPVNSSFVTLQKGNTPLSQSGPISSKGMDVEVFDPEFEIYWKVRE